MMPWPGAPAMSIFRETCLRGHAPLLRTVACGAIALLGACGGASSGSTTATLPVSMQLDAVAQSSTATRLQWTRHEGATSYAIYVNETLARDGQWSGPSPAFTFTALVPQTRYCYRIVAIQDYWPFTRVAVGRSNDACVTTPRDLPPSAPGSLSAVAISPGGIQLTWAAASDDFGVTGYRVFRDGAPLATVPVLAFIDGGLYPQQEYCYLVASFDAANNETRAATPACAVTPADVTPPSSPAYVDVVPRSPTELALSWPDADDDGLLLGYRVYRDGAFIAATPVPALVDAGLAVATRYCYEVGAYDAGGNESDRRRTCVIAGWQRHYLGRNLHSAPALAVDRAGRPEMAYCRLVVTEQRDWTYRLTRVQPGEEPEDLASPGETACTGPDLAHDSQLQPHISYFGQHNNLKHWAGHAEIVAPAMFGYRATAIGIDGADRLHVAHGTNRAVVYSKKEGGAWSSLDVDDVEPCTLPLYDVATPDLAVAPGGTVHLAYLAGMATGGCEVRHASSAGGAWVIETLAAPVDGAAPPAVGVTATGEVRIAYALHFATGRSELYVAARSADGWSAALVHVGLVEIRRVALAIGPDGVNHVGWGAAGGAVNYATDAGGQWRVLMLEEADHGGPSLAVDAAGDMHIAYGNEGGAIVYLTSRPHSR
jgi:hypothetical protein